MLYGLLFSHKYSVIVIFIPSAFCMVLIDMSRVTGQSILNDIGLGDCGDIRGATVSAKKAVGYLSMHR